MRMGKGIESRGTTRTDTESIKADGWKDQGILVVNKDDDRLTWPEADIVAEMVRWSASNDMKEAA